MARRMGITFKRLLLGASIALNVALAGNMIWGGQGLMAYRALEREILALRDGLNSLQEKNFALSREIKLLRSDDKYIEHMVRKRQHFVRDNEIWYIFSDEDTLRVNEDAHETEN